MKYGLIGEKLGHSYSVEIHNAIGGYDYELCEVPKSELGSFMSKADFRAINVTIPYKEAVIPYLDHVDPVATETGAVNTIVKRDGRLFGYNTDFLGLRSLILSMGLELSGRKVLVLGSGGTGRTACAVAKELGATTVIVVSRREGNGHVSYPEAASCHSDAHVIINTTPCGMYPNLEGLPLPLEKFIRLEGVVDVIYNPLRTNLVLEAQRLGLKARGGLFMLVQQGIAASELFFDCRVEQSKAETVCSGVLRQKRNIVLVGMAGSGKSTVGRLLSERMGLPLADTDQLVLERTGKSPSDLIQEYGEPYFRNVESLICKELESRTGLVIATGGGAVLREVNVNSLKHNGSLIFLDRDVSHIEPTVDRPLTSTHEKLEELYKKRYPIYKACADFHIDCNRSVQEAVSAVMEVL